MKTLTPSPPTQATTVPSQQTELALGYPKTSPYRRHLECLAEKGRTRVVAEVPVTVDQEIETLARTADKPRRVIITEALRIGLKTVKRSIRLQLGV